MIRLENISLDLPGFSLADINFRVEPGKFFALIGPTGAGKTLILETIAGLIKPSRGKVIIRGEDVSMLPAEKRGVAMVYQDNALFPHLDVLKNICFGLRYMPKENRTSLAEVEAIAEMLRIRHLLSRKVLNLSGGEKQRVALARALASRAKVLLLDEPLSALDPNLRQDLRALLADMHEKAGLTCLMVTHDFHEVLTLAHEVAVMSPGRLEQTGAVADVFQHPATPFVARFVGAHNLFPARFENGRAMVRGLCLQSANINGCKQGYVCVRPEKVRLTHANDGGPNTFAAKVVSLVDLGSHLEAGLKAEGGLDLECILPAGSTPPEMGREVCCHISPESVHCLAEH